MSYPQAIFGGFALLAAVLLLSNGAQTRAESGSFEGVMSGGRSVQTGDMIWRINKQTGAVSICYGPNTREAPACSPWSK